MKFLLWNGDIVHHEATTYAEACRVFADMLRRGFGQWTRCEAVPTGPYLPRETRR